MNDEVMDAGAEAPVNDTTPAQVQETQSSEPSTTESGEFDLRAELEKAFDKHTGSDKPRDEHGRWTKADGSTEDAPEADEVPAETTDEPVKAETSSEDGEPTETEVKQAETKPAIDAPHSAPSEIKEVWASIPPVAQEFFARREREAHDQISRLGQVARQHEPFQQVMEHYRTDFERRGVDPANGFAAMLNVQRQLDADPYTAIQSIAGAYGVDLSLFGNGTENADGTAPSVEVASLIRQNQIIQSEVAQLRQEAAERQAREAEIQQQTVASEIDAFLASNPVSDEQMQELAEYVGYLTQTQPHLSTKDRLATAYKRIVAENPRVVEERLKAQQAAEAAKKAEEAKKKASEAKKVAHLNVKSSPANMAPRKFKSLEEEVAWVYDNRAAG